ncbi:MAG: phage portal protein [Lachnospiraceae bacterium]|nr:phage portal protein [Lachnospiraceae bacterium]
MFTVPYYDLNVYSGLGRLMIMTDETVITRDNIEEVVNAAYLDHQRNLKDEVFLTNYEKGRQGILNREKDIRPSINAKPVINEASRIVDTHVGYCFANPITLVERAENESDATGKDDESIAELNGMFYEQNKGAKDFEAMRMTFINGIGYQMVLPARQRKKDKKNKKAPFELLVPNPMTTFVVYSNDAYREKVLGCTYSIKKDGSIRLTAYSEDWVYELSSESGSDFKMTTTITPNVIGMIPIVEFALNDRMGIFEKVIPILDYLNLIDADRINDIMQHVQSLLWMHNCSIDGEGKKNLVDGDGVIMTKSTGDGHEAKITYLNQTLNEAEIQTLADHLLEELEKITATPSWKEASGGSTTGAMQLSNGWQCLEISAKAIEQAFSRPELELVELAIEIIKADSRPFEGVKDIDISDIEIRFSRTKNYDLVSKTNALVSLINAGVDGQTAFKTVELFTDANQAWVDSARIIEGMQEKLIAKEEPSTNNIIANANAATDERGFGGVNNDEKDKTEESIQPSKVITE